MSDYESAQRRRNIFVGLFVILGLCALGWLIFKFGDLPSSVSKLRSFEVFVQIPTAPGVQKDTPVRFCGYRIGRVIKVMAPDIRENLNTGKRYHQSVIVLAIDKRYVDIPCNVEVKLMTRGLGSSYIELKVDPQNVSPAPRDTNRPETRFLVDQMWVQGSTGMTSEFFPEESQKKLEELISGLRTFMDNASEIIGDPNNKENIKKTLANLTEASHEATITIKHASQTLGRIEQTLANADKTIDEYKTLAITGTETIKGIDVKAENLIAAMVTTSEELGKASSQMRLVLEKVNAGQGSAGKFINDARLYEGLLESNEQLQVLIGQISVIMQKVNEKGLRGIY